MFPTSFARIALRTLALAALLLAADVEHVARTSGPFAQDAYVWQRAWTAEVRDAVRERGPEFASLCVLGAEIEGAHVVRADVDWRAVAGAGVALRVGPRRGTLSADDAAGRLVRATARELVAAARAGGAEPRELQIDFDAATSQLPGYRAWIDAVRADVAPVPVTFTALPAWLGASGFGALARAADGFVLQVHSLERPRGPDDLGPLCDAARARAWVERAARVGVPFRVALPTYGYLVAFDGEGRFAGLSAEGAARAWREGSDVRALRSDPAAMAGLVGAWTLERPAAMRGVVWYRLPVEGDRMNWSWTTLARVRRGEAPAADVVAEVTYPEAGLAEVRLRNRGDADGRARTDVAVTWTDARLVASDTTHGFDARGGRGELAVRGTAAIEPERLAPGASRLVAWLRFDRGTEVTAHASR